MGTRVEHTPHSPYVQDQHHCDRQTTLSRQAIYTAHSQTATGIVSAPTARKRGVSSGQLTSLVSDRYTAVHARG